MKEITVLIESDKKHAEYRSLRAWAKLGKIPRPGAQGELLPAVCTSAANAHIVRQLYYSSADVIRRAAAARLRQGRVYLEPKNNYKPLKNPLGFMSSTHHHTTAARGKSGRLMTGIGLCRMLT